MISNEVEGLKKEIVDHKTTIAQLQGVLVGNTNANKIARKLA